MDAIEQLAWDAEEAVGVLGRGEEFVLVTLGEPLPDAVLEYAHRRKYRFCGVLAIVSGRGAARCADADAIPTMCAAAVAFGQQVAEKLKAERGSADWLRRLFEIPDRRTEN